MIALKTETFFYFLKVDVLNILMWETMFISIFPQFFPRPETLEFFLDAHTLHALFGTNQVQHYFLQST